MNILIQYKANKEKAIIQADSAEELLDVLTRNELINNKLNLPESELLDTCTQWFKYVSQSITVVSSLLTCYLSLAPTNVKLQVEPEVCPTCNQEIIHEE